MSITFYQFYFNTSSRNEIPHVSRIQPLHLFIVCLTIGLFSVVQRGVFWFIAEDAIFNCKKYWWSNLLLINNLFTITDIVCIHKIVLFFDENSLLRNITPDTHLLSVFFQVCTLDVVSVFRLSILCNNTSSDFTL